MRRARGEPYGRLLLARFFYVDAIATVIQFMTVYARRTGDFDGREIDALLADRDRRGDRRRARRRA